MTGWPVALRRMAGIAALVPVLACSCFAGAAENEQRIRLSADRAWQPFIVPRQPEGGVITDLVVSSFERAGYEADVSWLPWSRVLEATARGDYDAIAGIYRTPERRRRFLFSEPFLQFRVSLIARRDFPRDEYESLDDLQGHSVGVIEDAAYPDALYEADLDLHTSTTRQGLVRMLQNKRIDLLADTESLFRHHALDAGINPDRFIVLDPPLRTEELYIAAPRTLGRAESIIEAFNTGLAELKESTDYLKIRRKHGF